MKMCNEMKELRRLLDIYRIRWEPEVYGDSHHRIWRTRIWYGGSVWSVINGFGTYGGYSSYRPNNMGLLEAMNMTSSVDVVGYLTANEVMHLIRKGAKDGR